MRDRLLSGEVAHIAVEHRMRRGEDEWITVGVNGYAIEDPTRRKAGRRLIIGFVSDVSERIRAEAERQALAAQLRQAEKMEAVGRLAGGIAHDFNNILGAILGYGELAQAKVESDPQLKRYVDTIVGAGERGKALVSQILAYSRADSSTREPVILGSVVTEACELLRGSSSAGIEVRLAVQPEELVVSGDPTRLHQLVMNLASNALHAMPEGGVLEIGLARRTLADPVHTRLSEVPAGEWAVLEVRDTGEGIRPDGHRPHLRALLHHQAGGARHRAGARARALDRQGARRGHRRGERGGQGHDLHGLAPAPGGRRRGGAEAATPPSAARARWCSSWTTSRRCSRPSRRCSPPWATSPPATRTAAPRWRPSAPIPRASRR